MVLNVIRHPSEFTKKQKANAARSLGKAIREGQLQRPTSCTCCGDTGRIEGHHHYGYDERNELNVLWLCKECHAIAHGDLNLIFGCGPIIRPFSGRFTVPL